MSARDEMRSLIQRVGEYEATGATQKLQERGIQEPDPRIDPDDNDPYFVAMVDELKTMLPTS